MVPRTIRQVIALLSVFLIVGAVMVCQVHTTAPDHGHAVPHTSHASPSPHSLLDFSCLGLAAVLSVIMTFTLCLFQMLYATPLVLKHAVLIFPLFIPPRPTTRQVRIRGRLRGYPGQHA